MKEIVLDGKTIRLLKGAEIDIDRWDKCVENSDNESPLAYSWVLDIIAIDWYGIVIEDYCAVMPLPYTNTLGYELIQMPAGILNLGLFTTDNELLTKGLDLERIIKLFKIKFISYSFVFQQKFETNIRATKKITHYLPLNRTYPDLFKKYEQRHRRNVKDFRKNDIEIIESSDPSDLISIRQIMGKNIPVLRLTNEDKQFWSKLIITSIAKGCGKLYYCKQGDEVLAGTFFLVGKKRIVFAFSVVLPEKKNYKLTFGMIDNFIRLNSEQDKILDLCGSNIRNIALFLRGFGATSTTYIHYERNKLPYLLRISKKHNLIKKMKDLFS